jgi:bacterioferritin
MKGNPEVLAVLNEQLESEVTAVAQYMLGANMLKNWGYLRLAKIFESEAKDEMRHAEALIEHILFLEGKPEVYTKKYKVGMYVEEQLSESAKAESGAILLYNKGVEIALKAGDNASRKLMDNHLASEVEHLNWVEGELYAMKDAGKGPYLAAQVGE